METPSSTRRLLRSQTRSKLRGNDDRAALIDITNDSPIVGLAAGNLKTPLSTARAKTPGSGEAILRCQVETLLQKVVEEEIEVVKDSLIGIFDHLRSPASLLAPTPANTPQIGPLPIIEPPKVEETPDLSDCVINRALLFHSPEESDSSFPLSDLTSEESVTREASEDDSSSVWSLQVHDGSSQRNDEEVEEEDEVEDADDEGEDLDDLCEGMKRMCVGKNELPEFAGKHIRFNYDSDGEIVGEEEVKAVSPSVIRLKGLPMPEGKHLRFHEEEEED